MTEASTPKNIQCTRYEGIVCCIVARVCDEVCPACTYIWCGNVRKWWYYMRFTVRNVILAWASAQCLQPWNFGFSLKFIVLSLYNYRSYGDYCVSKEQDSFAASLPTNWLFWGCFWARQDAIIQSPRIKTITATLINFGKLNFNQTAESSQLANCSATSCWCNLSLYQPSLFSQRTLHDVSSTSIFWADFSCNAVIIFKWWTGSNFILCIWIL